MVFPHDNDTDQAFCSRCCEPCDDSPSVEAFELFGEVICPDCAAALFEAAEDAETLARANPLEPGFRRLDR